MKRWGVLFQPGALWIGAHFSTAERRWCINLLPMVTLWITRKGGRPPKVWVDRQEAHALAHAQHTFSDTFDLARKRRQKLDADARAIQAWRDECEAVARRSCHL